MPDGILAGVHLAILGPWTAAVERVSAIGFNLPDGRHDVAQIGFVS